MIQLGDGAWEIPELIQLIEAVIQENTTFQDYEMIHEFPNIGLKTLHINARQIRQMEDQPVLVLLAIEVVD